jgi:hypothetical protein
MRHRVATYLAIFSGIVLVAVSIYFAAAELVRKRA